MPRGYEPKPSTNVDEERVITWRHTGDIHNRLINVTRATRRSLNLYITKAVTEKIERDEENIQRALDK